MVYELYINTDLYYKHLLYHQRAENIPRTICLVKYSLNLFAKILSFLLHICVCVYIHIHTYIYSTNYVHTLWSTPTCTYYFASAWCTFLPTHKFIYLSDHCTYQHNTSVCTSQSTYLLYAFTV